MTSDDIGFFVTIAVLFIVGILYVFLPRRASRQREFDLTIGRLDRVLSEVVNYAKKGGLDEENRQTLKHHAEDMIAAGECILKKLDRVEGTPQPSKWIKSPLPSYPQS